LERKKTWLSTVQIKQIRIWDCFLGSKNHVKDASRNLTCCLCTIHTITFIILDKCPSANLFESKYEMHYSHPPLGFYFLTRSDHYNCLPLFKFIKLHNKFVLDQCKTVLDQKLSEQGKIIYIINSAQ
jgi:hypothetical protein